MTKRRWYRKVYLRSNHWKQLKKQLFRIRKKRCEKCGANKYIQVHHVNYHSIYDVTTKDLLILCRNCHKKEHRKK